MEHIEADRQRYHDVSGNAVQPNHKKTRARLKLLMDYHLEANPEVPGYSDLNAAVGSNDAADSNADSIALSDIDFSDVDLDHAVESSNDSAFELEDEVEGISTTANEEVASQRPYPATVTRRGIHPQLLDEVDALLNMGWGAKQLRSMLNHRYHDEPRSLRMVPSCKQLENRKAFLVRCSANGWDISNHVAFTAWSSQKVCDTREKFMAVDDPNDRRMDEMIVLDTFIFDGQAPDEGKYSHRFIPWVYIFVRTDSKAGYAKMFEVVCERALSFLGVEIQIAFESLDHSEAIASAFCEEIESHHSVIKKTCVPTSRASINGVLSGILPRILKADGEDL
ncbi:uncharacterized protein PITG_13929 [Phytophthora infestans T30-4]|uniref:MULE transposase domain-containing protein n=1 Tax=Phytophthora infestans (strain T30-4) TaxID=403677 RepID=D0NN48_PHYIT|nr:uncharacterized protein PITG_13929 [Phytophthora infestans T30-4]EEY61955.1 conserved hypothetical protein [Phytophthora infestans T30-4]|eukprot:XP_002899595.1 conserved hypothetical protein [Phytophthora infestans T30-4]